MNDVNPKYDPAYEDMTPAADLCGEKRCAEYRDGLECRVQGLEAKVREQLLQNGEARRLIEKCRDVVDDDLENRPARHSLGRLYAELQHWLSLETTRNEAAALLDPKSLGWSDGAERLMKELKDRKEIEKRKEGS